MELLQVRVRLVGLILSVLLKINDLLLSTGTTLTKTETDCVTGEEVSIIALNLILI
jgi:hypothetical protein